VYGRCVSDKLSFHFCFFDLLFLVFIYVGIVCWMVAVTVTCVVTEALRKLGAREIQNKYSSRHVSLICRMSWYAYSYT
jgi:hypothetical protein